MKKSRLSYLLFSFSLLTAALPTTTAVASSSTWKFMFAIVVAATQVTLTEKTTDQDFSFPPSVRNRDIKYLP